MRAAVSSPSGGDCHDGRAERIPDSASKADGAMISTARARTARKAIRRRRSGLNGSEAGARRPRRGSHHVDEQRLAPKAPDAKKPCGQGLEGRLRGPRARSTASSHVVACRRTASRMRGRACCLEVARKPPHGTEAGRALDGGRRCDGRCGQDPGRRFRRFRGGQARREGRDHGARRCMRRADAAKDGLIVPEIGEDVMTSSGLRWARRPHTGESSSIKHQRCGIIATKAQSDGR
jgi:hypothetical protein